MKFHSPLVVVENIERAKAFYENVLGQKLLYDFGENIVFEGEFSLHLRTHFEKLTGAVCAPQGSGQDFELYFDEENFDELAAKIKGEPSVRLLHDVVEHPWGQRTIRFFDPDGHLIEVGEQMESVVRRFFDQGLSPAEIVVRSQHPMEFVEKALAAHI